MGWWRILEQKGEQGTAGEKRDAFTLYNEIPPYVDSNFQKSVVFLETSERNKFYTLVDQGTKQR